MSVIKNDRRLSTPQAGDWNSYWSLDATERFTRISWSKKRIIQVLAPYTAAGKMALDAGCGSGFFSKHFCDRQMNVYSLDYSDEALKIAERATAGRSRVFKKDLVDSNLSQEVSVKFDLIFSDGLFEHFSSESQDAIMKNLTGTLSDNGVIVTFVPNRWSPWELIRPFYMPGIEEKPFVLKNLVDLHVRSGLKIVEQGGINTLPIAFSPDRLVGHLWGMLLFVIARKHG